MQRASDEDFCFFIHRTISLFTEAILYGGVSVNQTLTIILVGWRSEYTQYIGGRTRGQRTKKGAFQLPLSAKYVLFSC